MPRSRYWHEQRRAPIDALRETIRFLAVRPRTRRPISASAGRSRPAGNDTSGLRDCTSVARRPPLDVGHRDDRRNSQARLLAVDTFGDRHVVDPSESSSSCSFTVLAVNASRFRLQPWSRSARAPAASMSADNPDAGRGGGFLGRRVRNGRRRLLQHLDLLADDCGQSSPFDPSSARRCGSNATPAKWRCGTGRGTPVRRPAPTGT